MRYTVFIYAAALAFDERMLAETGDPVVAEASVAYHQPVVVLKVICERLSHPENARQPITETLEPIVTSSRAVQSRKIESPMMETLSGIVTLFSFVQELNTLLPSEMIELGSSMDSRLEQ